MLDMYQFHSYSMAIDSFTSMCVQPIEYVVFKQHILLEIDSSMYLATTHSNDIH